MEPLDIEKRAIGCLLGLAVGDALGSPLQFMTEPQVQIKHGTVRNMIGGGWLLLRPGETTDDTELAMLLAGSLVERRGFDAEDVARRYVEWFRGGPKEARGVLRTSLSLLAEGSTVSEASAKAHELSGEDSADNTTLMRCAPLALSIGTAWSRLVEAAVAEAAITHLDSRAGAGSAALVTVLALLLEGTPREEVLDRAFDLLEENESGIENLLPDVAIRRRDSLRPGPYVVDTLEVALHGFRRAESFEDALVSTANLGGEADTTTSVAGALAGACWGADAIPRRWLRALVGRTAIRNAARGLLALRSEELSG